jgi:transketolase
MLPLHDQKLAELEQRAAAIRRDIVKMLVQAGSGHSAGPLGLADLFAALYFHVLKHDPEKPLWSERDRFYLSNGHVCPVFYATLAHAGYFPTKDLMRLRRLGSGLQGHPEYRSLPGIEHSSGPLGNGSAQACGAAWALRHQGSKSRVYCVVSDGELQEGITWESLMFAAKERLSNLVWIVDRNHIQIDGTTEMVMPLEPLADKFRTFNWHVQECDGNNIRSFVDAIGQAQAVQEIPSIILAHTTPGKGVPFMENRYEWHGKPPNPEEAKAALQALRSLNKHILTEND